MSGKPAHDDHEGGREHGSADQLSDEGAGLGMGEEGTTFEPEETPEAVDEPEDGAEGASAGAAGAGGPADD